MSKILITKLLTKPSVGYIILISKAPRVSGTHLWMEQVGSGRFVACQKEVLGVVALTALSPEGFLPSVPRQ